MTSKVIVFGPTGAVGSITALTAQDLGAHVVLAMRDTSKPIPGLTPETEKQGAFERIHADLTKPDTVRTAVTKSGAKHAFLYLAMGLSDNMKGTIEALKDAGIEQVVFLSSFTVRGELRAIEPSEVISWIHAQVEINLEDVFGAEGYVAVRPGSFASNTVQYKDGLEEGEVKVFTLDTTVDCIAPEDIGRVSGTVLAKGVQGGERAIYLYGPELLTQKRTVEILAERFGKSPKIVAATEEETYKKIVETRGLPKALADFMIHRLKMPTTETSQVFGYAVEEEHLANVQKYTGRKAMTFGEWVDQNKQKYV